MGRNSTTRATATAQPTASASTAIWPPAASSNALSASKLSTSPTRGLSLSTTLTASRPGPRTAPAPGDAVTGVLMDENKALRDRLNTKTTEAFELQRQLDRAQQEIREKERVNGHLMATTTQNARELQSQELRLSESTAHAERLHEMADRVREEDDVLHRENAVLEERVQNLREDINQAEAEVNKARLQQQQTDQDCQFRLNVIEEAKAALEHELDQAKDELQSFALELQSCEDRFGQKDEGMTQLKDEMARLEEENSRVAQKAKEWHDESERLRRLIDEKNRLHFEVRGEGDTQMKHLKLELHEMHSQVAGLEVDKNVFSAAKLDLTHEVSRLKRRSDEREQQVKRLLRVIEEKDQTIAEMGPAMREAKRASASAAKQLYKKTQQSGWRA